MHCKIFIPGVQYCSKDCLLVLYVQPLGVLCGGFIFVAMHLQCLPIKIFTGARGTLMTLYRTLFILLSDDACLHYMALL